MDGLYRVRRFLTPGEVAELNLPIIPARLKDTHRPHPAAIRQTGSSTSSHPLKILRRSPNSKADQRPNIGGAYVSAFFQLGMDIDALMHRDHGSLPPSERGRWPVFQQ
jgi:hypothetical protein